ncbi:50S ribosomal protein L3 [uncultured archaeon]|nr:50S ribosomal protein L3 [uncultured archaeon]
MGARRSSRKGSLAFRPRKRAETQMPRIGHWPTSTERRLLGFAAYKAGMTSVAYIDDSTSPNAGNEIVGAATILEVPAMTVYGIRGMKFGQVVADEIVDDQKLLNDISLKLKKKNKLESKDISDVFILAFTHPDKTGFGKKKADKMMIAVGGKDAADKLEYARTLLGKEVKASDAFKPGEFVDAVSITKGKGWQGTVKRFNTHQQRRKATGKRRHIGTLGPWHPGYVFYTVPHPGQMGYHKRTEINKRILKFVTPEEVNPSGGFPHYGLVKNECLLMVGSLGGPQKRLVRLRKAARTSAAPKTPDVRMISRLSKN